MTLAKRKPARRKPAESQYPAAARRLAHALEVLRKTYIGKGWAVDEEGAAKALKAVRMSRATHFGGTADLPS
jgi:hypothetical protein